MLLSHIVSETGFQQDISGSILHPCTCEWVQPWAHILIHANIFQWLMPRCAHLATVVKTVRRKKTHRHAKNKTTYKG